MYNLLLVDDEVHVLEGLKADLDTGKLGIANVFEALNLRQAQEFFGAEKVHILLCDIEMPRGNGLELLQWVNEHHPGTVCIFLTSHAEFKYARQAIQLRSLDYLLKPISAEELEQVIRKAIREVQNRDELRHSAEYRQLVKIQQPVVMEKFWLDLITRSIPTNPKSIREYAERYHLPLGETMRFIPILLGIHRWHKPLTLREEKIMEYALKKSAEEMILPGNGYGHVLEWRRGMLFAVVSREPADGNVFDLLKRDCETFIANCNRYFSCDLSCYIGREVPVHEITNEVDRLLAMEQNNVADENQVFLPGGLPRDNRESPPLPEMGAWAALLKCGSQDALYRKVAEELGRLAASRELNARLLHEFRHDFLQMVYSVLNVKGIQAHRLFGDEISTHLFAEATRSVKDMMAWVRHTVERAVEQKEEADRARDVIDKAKQYIARHLDREDLAREIIAREVCLHPDYLSRLFKRVTGQSITDYILQARINLAKELLENTNMSVGEVAASVGYYNFSHFTKMFKKLTGSSPKDYRKKGHESAKARSGNH